MPTTHEDGGARAVPDTHWVVQYDSLAALQEAYDAALIHGALFVPTRVAPPPGAAVHLELHLSFCGTQLLLEGKAVGTRPATPAEQAGVSIQLATSPASLRAQLEAASGASLPDPDPTPPGLVERAPRFNARASVDLLCEGRRYLGETANLSVNGMLVLVHSRQLTSGKPLQLCIEGAAEGRQLVLPGRVSNNTRCYGGVMALGVQFLYELSRCEEVERFVDELRSFHHARWLATVTGSLDLASLESVLENFANAASGGTLVVTRGEQSGRIAFRDGQLLQVSAGLASGVHGLARLLTWTGAKFELRPEVDITGEPEALPVTSALVAASVERDELARFGAAQLGPETTFQLDPARLRALARALDDFAHEIVENAALGFPLGALIDFVDVGDGRFYAALSQLVEQGVLRVFRDDATQPILRPAAS